MSGDSRGFIAALDIGTTTLKCQIFGENLQCKGSSFQKVKLLYPDKNSVEIDPEELWISIISTVQNAVSNSHVTFKDIKSLAISTQRCTFLTWNKTTGEPFHNFITWKDLRATDLIKNLNKSWKMFILRFGSYLIHLISRRIKFDLVRNLKFTSGHVTIRLLWILQNNSKVQKALHDNNLLFGTLDTWLIYKLTKEKCFLTDISNASATGLYDPFNLCWSFIPEYFNIPLNILPKVVDNDYEFGKTDPEIFGVSLKIATIMADQSAAMYGSKCFKENDIKLTLGTGAFFNLNTGNKIRASIQGSYPLVGWKIDKELIYLTEAACHDSGSLIEWMLKTELIRNISELEVAISGTKNNAGVYFIPAFSGLGVPINDETATSGFIGIKPDTNKNHLIRAVLESIVYRSALAYKALNKEIIKKIHCIRLDGGVSRNNFICQLLSNLLNITIKRSNSEMSTLGVAFIAGISCEFFKNLNEISEKNNLENIFDSFEPTESAEEVAEVKENLKNWLKAVERFKKWYK